MALWLPLLVGSRSDRLRTPIGGRLPFLLAGSPVLAVGLVALGVVHSTMTVALAALVFFTGYFLVGLLRDKPPLRAFLVDQRAVGARAGRAPLMPEEEHGVLSGCYSFSRGLGTWLGPLLAGLSITALAPAFPAAAGFHAMWLPVSGAVLVSLRPLRAVAKAARDGVSA